MCVCKRERERGGFAELTTTMLCSAAVSAAAAAVWLLAALGPGLSLPAEDNSDPGFTLCSHCFYRQTPPRGASAGPLLRPLCHSTPGGQAFATLYKPACDTAVYYAFNLSHGWAETQTQEEDENTEIAIPALLRGAKDPSEPPSSADSPLQHWDSAVTKLLLSSITPHCSTLVGDLYILTGVGGLGAADGDQCQTKPLWSAVCCAVPGGKGGFSLGLISETEEGEKQVTLKELEEKLGGADLFSEGCAGAVEETAGVVVGLNSEARNMENLAAEASSEDMASNDLASDINAQDAVSEGQGLDATSQDSNTDVKENGEGVAGEHVAAFDAEPDQADVADGTQEAAVMPQSGGEERDDATHLASFQSESSESTDEDGAAAVEAETDTNSSSTVMCILSTTLSLLKAPLRPVFSTITQLPGQVTYVLQEDLGVLSTLPGDTVSLLHLFTSDLLSWMGSGAEMLYGIGENCFSSVHYCASSMLGALLSSCHTGVTGIGMLAGDTAGIFGDTLDNAWWVTKFFGGRLWEQSEGYVGTVVTEMGGQAKALGGGLGRLAWRCGNGVANVFKLGGGLIMGMVDVVFGAVREGWGQESESN